MYEHYKVIKIMKFFLKLNIKLVLKVGSLSRYLVLLNKTHNT